MNKSKTFSFILFIFIILILGGMAAAASILVMPNHSKVYQKTVKSPESLEFTTKDWLKNVDDNVYINQLNLPGSHDSAAYNIPLSFKTRCQEEDIDKQLEFGIRYLDVRLKEKKTGLVLSHGFVTCLNEKGKDYTFKEFLEKCNEFIKKNPTEFIILNIKDEKISKEASEFSKDVEKEVKNVINSEKLYTEENIPKLSDVRGKIIIARRYKGDGLFGARITWKQQDSEVVDKNLYEINSNEGNIKVLVQDQFKLSKEKKQEAINHFFNNFEYQDNTYRINFLSCSGSFFDKPTKFLDCFEFNEKNFNDLKNKNGQIIVCDFVNQNKIKYIIKTNTKFIP